MLHAPAVTPILARFAEVPAAARQQAKRALLNFFAVALAGCRSPPVEIARKSLQEFSGHGQATVIGRRERMDGLSAAFLNAAAANVLDFCDTHVATVIHPTASVAAAVFWISELHRVSGV